jgi:hypothetical protein
MTTLNYTVATLFGIYAICIGIIGIWYGITQHTKIYICKSILNISIGSGFICLVLTDFSLLPIFEFR